LIDWQERGRILHKFADLIDQHIEELAMLDTVDAGKLFLVGKVRDIPGAAHLLRYYAGAADKIHGETLKMAQRMHGYTLKEPVGVVGHIVPWNYPSTMFFFKVSPALAAGCTVVVKPAEQTPLSALFYAHLAREAGVPDGVLNVVPGFGPTAGAALAAHMDVDKLSFTGSTEVGRLVMKAAAESNLKSVSLELGGKSPIVVFDDADLDMAVNLVNFATYTNKVCCYAYVVISYVLRVIQFEQSSFSSPLCNDIPCNVAGRDLCRRHAHLCPGRDLRRVREEGGRARQEIGGRGPVQPACQPRSTGMNIRDSVFRQEYTTLDATTNCEIAMQVDKDQYEKVLKYIDIGKREGATLVTGGKPCGDKGYYIEPTIFTDVKVKAQHEQQILFS
jgi:acyl-CoA reductase-like NAD-dependent aldehyde dehydrogenase